MKKLLFLLLMLVGSLCYAQDSTYELLNCKIGHSMSYVRAHNQNKMLIGKKHNLLIYRDFDGETSYTISYKFNKRGFLNEAQIIAKYSADYSPRANYIAIFEDCMNYGFPSFYSYNDNLITSYTPVSGEFYSEAMLMNVIYYGKNISLVIAYSDVTHELVYSVKQI